LTISSLAALIGLQRDTIVASFVAGIQRADLSPRGLSRALLTDHIPSFLDEIVGELERLSRVARSQDADDTSDMARQHGEQRWALGYDVQGLIREYGVLRHVILAAAKEANVPLSIDEFDILAKCLSVGVAEAATEYTRYRDKELNAQKAQLEFLVEAGQLLSSSLDYRSTLSRLTGLLIPRLADWCAVHLEGDSTHATPVAHVDPTHAELIRDLYRRYPMSPDAEAGFRHVIRTGEPQLIVDVDTATTLASAQNEDHRALLSQIGSSSKLIVPMRVQEHVFGALTLAYSTSGRRYGPADLSLLLELAGRAAVSIDNARLYELSQQERSNAEAATRAKDQLVAMVSHELRTPLNAILGWTRLLRGGSLSPAKGEHALEVIERNATAQNQLVDDLLDISRVITGKIRINPSQIDFANIVEVAVEGVRPAAEAKRLVIETHLADVDAVMRGDGDRLQQVVWNLLSNAVKFTPKGGKIKVSLRRVQSELEFEIEDTGEGIQPSFLPHVFESFRQVDGSESRRHGGLGVGLSIAKHIVELHGGVIAVHSAGKGLGTTFRARLPISPLVSPTLGVSRVPATAEPTARVSLPPGLDRVRVLVVDDEPDARELVAHFLEGCGMQVDLAGSAAEALAHLTSNTPDVIISDIGMPDQDGYFLIRSIRTLQNVEKSSIPAIALTAFTRNEDRTRALVEGFNLHMAKPVEPSVLVRAVADLATHGRRPSDAP